MSFLCMRIDNCLASFAKNTTFSQFSAVDCFLKSVHHRCMGLLLGSLFTTIHLFVNLHVCITVFCLLLLYTNIWSWKCKPPILIFFLKIILTPWCLLKFHILGCPIHLPFTWMYPYLLMHSSHEDLLIPVRFRQYD